MYTNQSNRLAVFTVIDVVIRVVERTSQGMNIQSSLDISRTLATKSSTGLQLALWVSRLRLCLHIRSKIISRSCRWLRDQPGKCGTAFEVHGCYLAGVTSTMCIQRLAHPHVSYGHRGLLVTTIIIYYDDNHFYFWVRGTGTIPLGGRPCNTETLYNNIIIIIIYIRIYIYIYIILVKL